MEYVAYNRSALSEFIRSQRFSLFRDVPISRHRAESQLRNPRARDEDALLIVAFEDGEPAGYLGVLPDEAYQGDTSFHIGWMSCLWVAGEHQGKKIAGTLLGIARETWRERLCATRMVPWLEPVYQRMGIFHPTVRKSGLRAYLRFPLADILPPRRPSFKSLRPLLRATDSAANLFHDAWVKLRSRNDDSGVSWNFTDVIDAETEQLILKHNTGELTRRGPDELRWILGDPWILEGDPHDEESSRYFFTSRRKRFFMRGLSIKDESNAQTAFAVIQVRDSALAVPYLYCGTGSRTPMAEALFRIMLKLRLDSVTTFDPSLAAAISSMRAPFIHLRKTSRPWLLPRSIPLAGEPVLQDGDGDSAFT
jgi:GNAT superfamily N-acetyltransferase